MAVKKLIPITLMALGLAACGGGSSDDGDSPSSGEQVSDNTNQLNGIYYGEGNESGFGQFEVISFVQDGRIYATANTGVGYSGSIKAGSGNEVTGSLTLYDFDNAAFDTAALNGEYASKDYIDVAYARQTGPEGLVSLAYSAQAYEQPASLSKIAGVWTVTNLAANTSVTINSEGEFFGTDSEGCVFSGSFSVPNSNANLYNVDLKLESCGQINGQYSGLSAWSSTQTGEQLLALVSNSEYGFAYDFIKQ